MLWLRVPMPADAEAAAHCQLACWREAYTGLVEPERLATLLGQVDDRVARWRQIIPGPGRQRLADDDGAVVGFASAGLTRTPGAGPEIELYALYLRQAYWGRGLGSQLLDAVLGDSDAALWVFRDNRRGVDFYARHGFVHDGHEQEQSHFGGIEVRMVRERR